MYISYEHPPGQDWPMTMHFNTTDFDTPLWFYLPAAPGGVSGSILVNGHGVDTGGHGYPGVCRGGTLHITQGAGMGRQVYMY